MDKTRKETLVKDFNEIFSSALTGVLVDYKGSSVADLTELRKNLYEKNSKFRVLRNSLAKRAVVGTPFEKLRDLFIETRALVYSDQDVVAPAKLITEITQKNENIKLIAGILVSGEKGKLLDTNGLKELGSLPSREELLVKMLYVMNAPITNFVRTLNEIPAGLVRVLKSLADSKE